MDGQTHECQFITINEGDYGTRTICLLCCDEEIRLAKKQREYDFYGTEVEDLEDVA